MSSLAMDNLSVAPPATAGSAFAPAPQSGAVRTARPADSPITCSGRRNRRTTSRTTRIRAPTRCTLHPRSRATRRAMLVRRVQLDRSGPIPNSTSQTAGDAADANNGAASGADHTTSKRGPDRRTASKAAAPADGQAVAPTVIVQANVATPPATSGSKNSPAGDGT